MQPTIRIYVDACTVKDDISKVAARHGQPVVAGAFIRVPAAPSSSGLQQETAQLRNIGRR